MNEQEQSMILEQQEYHYSIHERDLRIQMAAMKSILPSDNKAYACTLELLFNQGGIRNLPHWNKQDRQELAKRVRPSKSFGGKIRVGISNEGYPYQWANDPLGDMHWQAVMVRKEFRQVLKKYITIDGSSLEV